MMDDLTSSPTAIQEWEIFEDRERNYQENTGTKGRLYDDRYDDDEFAVADHLFIDNVANAQTTQEILVLLESALRRFNHDDETLHDKEILDGTACDFVSSLHSFLLIQPGSTSNRKIYRSTFSQIGALQITVLCAVVEMVLRCSDHILEHNIGVFQKNLIPCLPKLVDFFITWNGDETIRQFNLSNITKIIHRVSAYVGPDAEEQLFDILLIMLKGHVSPDIRVDTAISIASFFNREDHSERRERCIRMINTESSLIISTLSTAAMAASEEESAEKILYALAKLGSNASTIRDKMSKRRCTILAINKYLVHENPTLREIALDICNFIIRNNNNHYKLEYNTEILINKLIEVAKNDKEARLQLAAISLLGDAVSCDDSNAMKTAYHTVLDALLMIVKFGTASDPVLVEAAVTYIEKSIYIISADSLREIAELATLPYPRVRTASLGTLEVMLTNQSTAFILLTETEVLESFSVILSEKCNCDEDVTDVMRMVKGLAKHEKYHDALCQHTTLLSSIIALATGNRDKSSTLSRSCYILCVDTILTLISNEAYIRSFLPYTELLPWLVTLANSTTADEGSLHKKQLISAIVRLSSEILAENEETIFS